MVPCLGCGRSFCRLCDPPKGAGQYCPSCYSEQLERLTAGSEEKRPAEMASRAPGSGLRARLKRKERSPREKKVKEGRSSVVLEKSLTPFRWIKAATLSVGRAFKAAAIFLAGLPKLLAILVARAWRWLVREIRDHFPVGLAPREALEGDPPFKEAWYKLAAFVGIGIVVWVVIVAIAGQRNPVISIGVSIIVAAGVVWAMDSKYGVTTAVVAVGIVLISLMLGELIVQLLFRFHVIKRLDLQLAGLVSLNKPSTFYRSFVFKLVVWRLLPSAVVAFLIGWWPLKRRFSWVGFRVETAADAEADPIVPKRHRAPGFASRKPSKRLRVKEPPAQAVTREQLQSALKSEAGDEEPGGASTE
jgi:hypothetical protein